MEKGYNKGRLPGGSRKRMGTGALQLKLLHNYSQVRGVLMWALGVSTEMGRARSWALSCGPEFLT